MIKSSKPGKQRKFRAKAPLHLKRNFLKVHISKELKEKLKTSKRTLLVKKGDKVRVTAGSSKGRTGNVVNVSYNKAKLSISGLTRVNARGQEKRVVLDPSNVELIGVKIDDNRKKVFERSKQLR